MPYRIIVAEIAPHDAPEPRPPITRYEQVVEEIDLLAVMATVNKKTRKHRERKAKAVA